MNNTRISPTIRPVRDSDRDQWEELFLAYGVFYETSFPPETIEGVWGWLMDSNHPVSCFVASDGSTLLGFAHIREHPDTFVAGPGWFLDDLFTRPGNRGHGVGRALISAVVAHAGSHGGGTVRWITAKDNVTARGLYDTLAKRTTWVMYEKEVES